MPVHSDLADAGTTKGSENYKEHRDFTEADVVKYCGLSTELFQNIVKAVFKWSKEIELKRERSVGKKFKRWYDQMTGRNFVREKGGAFKAESNKHSSREEVYRDTGDTNMGKKGINNKGYSTDQSLSSKPRNFKPSPT